MPHGRNGKSVRVLRANMCCASGQTCDAYCGETDMISYSLSESSDKCGDPYINLRR